MPDQCRGPRGAQRRGPASPGEAAALGGFLRTIRRDLEIAKVRNLSDFHFIQEILDALLGWDFNVVFPLQCFNRIRALRLADIVLHELPVRGSPSDGLEPTLPHTEQSDGT